MIYSIDQLCPSGGMGGYGFMIHLAPEFREAVLKSRIDQDDVNRVIEKFGPTWLNHCGWSETFDPENCGHLADPREIPSEETRPLHGHREIRVSWGEWGIEHLYVPGNACGLDIDRTFCVFRDGKVLTPHNVDHWGQVNLMLIVFTWFAHSITLEGAVRMSKLKD